MKVKVFLVDRKLFKLTNSQEWRAFKALIKNLSHVLSTENVSKLVHCLGYSG